MSRAFVREDIDPPERSGRKRSASGLPPGAVNYITSRGAARLRAEVAKLRDAGANTERIADLQRILSSVQVVKIDDTSSKSISFGATVTVTDTAGKMETFTVVGVDELGFQSDAVSWISENGKALLAAELGDRITLGDGRSVKIVKIDYRNE
jgi:transcription elongation factor GreB